MQIVALLFAFYLQVLYFWGNEIIAMKCKNCRYWKIYDWSPQEGMCKNGKLEEDIEVNTHDDVIDGRCVAYIDTNQNFGCVHFEGGAFPNSK